MKKYVLLMLVFSTRLLLAQLQHNTTLIGNINYGRFTNDVWGYTDSSGTDYAIVGVVDGVSIVKVTSEGLEEVSFIPGTQSIWRDIKTHSHYAYVTADQGSDGLTIIDLSALPDSARLVQRQHTDFQTAHNLYIADGFAYISGSNAAGGADILDLSDPENPVKVGQWDAHYFHDIIVRNDTLFGSAGGSSGVVVLDVHDKTSPVMVTNIPLPDGGFSHNAWVTEDGRYLLTTQENKGLTVKMWDITDVFHAVIVDEYLSAPSLLAHNAHIRDDYAYISHYGDGLRILDISERDHMVEVAFYDTYSNDSGALFEGNWGAFPFTASGYVYASDEDNGLFVVEFNGRKASRLRGRIVDTESNEPVPDAHLEILESGTSARSDAEGNYKLGFADPGSFTVVVSHQAYETTTEVVQLQEGETRRLDIPVQRKPTGSVSGTILAEDGTPVSQAQILFLDTGFDLQHSNENGGFQLDGLPAGRYTVAIGKWGLRTQYREVEVVGNQATVLEVRMERGYFDDFELDLGWEPSDGSNNFRGPWQIVVPGEIGFGLPFHPPEDVTDPPGEHAYFARTLEAELSLTSPPFDLSDQTKAVIRYFQYWHPRGGNRDSLVVEISSDNGTTWTLLDAFSDNDATEDWQAVELAVPESVALTGEMRVRFTSKENGAFSSFALLDNFEVRANVTSVAAPTESAPVTFRLDQNYPNPFNAGTRITYTVPERTEVTLRIFNVVGEEIVTLVRAVQSKGTHQVAWDGRNQAGQAVASGVYFYRLQAAGRAITRKMILMQ